EGGQLPAGRERPGAVEPHASWTPAERSTSLFAGVLVVRGRGKNGPAARPKARAASRGCGAASPASRAGSFGGGGGAGMCEAAAQQGVGHAPRDQAGRAQQKGDHGKKQRRAALEQEDPELHRDGNRE